MIKYNKIYEKTNGIRLFRVGKRSEAISGASGLIDEVIAIYAF